MMKSGRRQFLKGAGLSAVAAPWIVPSCVLGSQSPSNKVTMGFIGTGVQGLGWNLKAFLKEQDCQVLAVCDVKPEEREAARRAVDDHYGTRDCYVTDDFRELLARQDIDAVCITTPDHWHTPMALMALEAEKDVICEKPTLSIAEGRELVEAVERSGRVFTTGLEDRSVHHYHKLAEVVRNGAIGKLQRSMSDCPTKTRSGRFNPNLPFRRGSTTTSGWGPRPIAPTVRTSPTHNAGGRSKTLPLGP